ncbi:MAG: hypothetical protein IJA10_14800 [Lachnospiraceae bacterium]|nr:hypothetical protein [Lachnospiraceae bacterium]
MTKENTNLFSEPAQKETYYAMNGRKPNRNYKDTLFRFIFSDKEKLLGLYNALNNSNYTDTEKLEINTLENAVYLNIKNDISFVFQFDLYLFEHQSTFCPNMPLRDLQYVSVILENLTKNFDLYSSTLVKIPSPHFVVFYNGKEKKEDSMVLKLSDAFQRKEKEPQLELLVTMININYGKNKELLDACKDLNDYSIYVAKIRSYMEGNEGRLESIENDEDNENAGINGNIGTTKNIGNTGTTENTSGNRGNGNTKYKMTIEEAVERTIDDCIWEGILVDILTKFRAEVKKLSIFEYNARLHEETLKKEGYEEGCEEGREQGELKNLLKLVKKKLEKEKTIEAIAEELETDFTIVEQICEVIKNATPNSTLENLLGTLMEKNIKLDD